jgi:transcription factor SPN1
LDLLQARKREASDAVQSSSKRGESGYDSGDSYGSENYQRTKEDDDFIDVDGEDEEAVREYYAEQHFDDERPDEAMEDKPKKGKGSSSAKKRTRGPDQLSDDDMDNPIVAAVQRMKKKKKVKKGEQQLMVEAGEFLAKMEQAAIDDEAAIKQKKPGLNKLRMLPEVLAEISKVDMHRAYLESDFLKIAKRWIQPLPDGSLGNITVRQKLLATIAKMSGENGITTHDLKESDFGKLIMTLYMHKKETPALKRQHKNLIEQWSRIIFNKSGNMRNLSSAQAYRRGKETGLTAIARSQAAAAAMASTPESAKKKSNSSDLGAVLANGKRSARDAGKNRVRVPYSKGFQFTVRPQAIVGDVADKKTRITNVKEKRESLHKRMLEKNRPTSKNGRSANVSIEGRPTK